MRDYLTSDVDRVILDDAVIYRRVGELLKDMGSCLPAKLVLYESKDDVFEHYQLSEQIAGISDRKVWLDCGGYLIFDYTEAMTVIDVNSGRYSSGTSLEETVMRINREAAREIARQLRLRDIGGIIVVDFIDMHTEESQQEIVAILHEALASDKMRPKVQDNRTQSRRNYQEKGKTEFVNRSLRRLPDLSGQRPGTVPGNCQH